MENSVIPSSVGSKTNLTRLKRSLILLGFVVIKFLLSYFLLSPEYDLQRDEFLHLDQANHLAWGYLSVPPVTSWIGLMIQFLGNTIFWVKFFPALFGALTIVVVWKTIETLNGSLYALLLGATCILFSALLRLNLLYQPNSLDVLSWTGFYFIIIKYIDTRNYKWLYIGAIIFSIGFLNKYNIIFLAIGLLPAALLFKERKLFINKHFGYSLLLVFILLLPNFIWQYQNHFPIFYHLKELSETQLVNVQRWGFLKEQLFFFFGSLFVIIAGLYALLFYKPFRQYKFFALSFLLTLCVFTYFKAKGYYAIGIYPIYIAFGAVFLAHIFKMRWRRIFYPIAIIIPLLIFILIYKRVYPNKSPEEMIKYAKANPRFGLHRWEDGKLHPLEQDFADMLGWKELARKVDSVCATVPDLNETLILCDNYGQAGAINYYTTNKKITASSFSADYINWLRFDHNIKNVILVKEADDEDKERKVEIPLFDTVYLAAKRSNEFAREREIFIYVLLGAKVDINQRIKEEMERKKWRKTYQ